MRDDSAETLFLVGYSCCERERQTDRQTEKERENYCYKWIKECNVDDLSKK